jgi:2-polyprenyl-3-methyl-5-hydroxy-6-metoxy-1,4-benzoquinol methylase
MLDDNDPRLAGAFMAHEHETPQQALTAVPDSVTASGSAAERGLSALNSLVTRRRRPELMDQPHLGTAEHARALVGLRRINRVSRTDAILWRSIACLARTAAGRPIRVLDVASGGGDVPIALARRAMRARLDVQVEGCDMSEGAVRFAQHHATKLGAAVRFFSLDARADAIKGYYDILTCSLFLHHLDDADAVALLRKMAEVTRRLLLVDDLVRGRAGYALAWWGCRLLSRSPIVHHDGPLSVASSFTPAEALELARRAGLERVRIALHWPRRFLLSWSP